MSLILWLRGILLLRHADVVRDIGERRQRRLEVSSLSRDCPGSKVSQAVRLLGYQAGRIRLGERSSVGDGSILSCGDSENGYGEIHVGAGSWIGQYNNLRAGGGSIRIGKDCLISQFCTLVASNHGIGRNAPIRSQSPAEDRRGITIGDDVWLGSGVAVMPGVCIGDGAVVGANAVVTRDVPPYEIWAGVPARRIGVRE